MNSASMQPGQMSLEDAQRVLFEQVRGPILLEKLANVHNIRPANPAEAEVLLKMASSLRERYDAAQKSTVSPIMKAAAALDRQLNVAQKQAAANPTPANIKSAAAILAQSSPDVVRAALSWMTAS